MFLRLRERMLWFSRWSSVKRCVVCVVLVTLVLAVPVAAAFLRGGREADGTPNRTIAGTDERRFWVWISAVWLGFWICRSGVYLLLKVTQPLSKDREVEGAQPSSLLERLQNPLAFCCWTILNQLVFSVVSRPGTRTAVADTTSVSTPPNPGSTLLGLYSKLLRPALSFIL
jgi:hypothetical protein